MIWTWVGECGFRKGFEQAGVSLGMFVMYCREPFPCCCAGNDAVQSTLTGRRN
jgi:hypothetical protein